MPSTAVAHDDLLHAVGDDSRRHLTCRRAKTVDPEPSAFCPLTEAVIDEHGSYRRARLTEVGERRATLRPRTCLSGHHDTQAEGATGPEAKQLDPRPVCRIGRRDQVAKLRP